MPITHAAHATPITEANYEAAHEGSAGLAHLYPLDNYALDATYGDDFDTASLSGIWTRRNFTSGAETYQLEPTGSFMRIACTGRAAGDGYFQTAPSGDWTFIMSFIQRLWGASAVLTFGIACINSVGTGVATGVAVASGTTFCVLGVTTYTTYPSTFQQLPSDAPLQQGSTQADRKTWHRLRKSGTDYYGSYSLNGETWSNETPAFSSGITVDRVGMFFEPQATLTTTAYFDVDLFNKIA